MNKRSRQITVVAAVIFMNTPFCLGAEKLSFSMASSMIDTCRTLIEQYQRITPGVEVLPNYGSSGSLARQIDMGAPVDVYLSANIKWMDYLENNHRIDADKRFVVARNRLVFLGKENSRIRSLADLTSLDRIGMGSPKSVPAGYYAMQAMQAAGVYSTMLEQGKLVIAKDVRQTLVHADNGATDGSFVYLTDAKLAKNAVVLFEVPENLHDSIIYPLALTRKGEKNPAALAFFKYLASDGARQIIEENGFFSPDSIE